jgi:hypothetical protein
MRELITQYIPLAVTGRTQIYVRKPRFEREVQPGEASVGNLYATSAQKLRDRSGRAILSHSTKKRAPTAKVGA